MEARNLDIRKFAKSRNIRLWQIAEALEMTDGSFSRKLRKELPDEEKAGIRRIVEKLARED